MRYDTVFFDLDGTVTDPGIGITNSVRHALAYWGITEPDRAALYPFIGPPLKESFLKYYGITDGDEAVRRYREYYADRGIFENEVYPGIPALLQSLRAAGVKIHLATSKPELFAEKILVHFGLRDYFDTVTGATMDERLVEKADVLREAMRRANADPCHSVMVGDRRHDVLGAAACGIPAIGVTYGYGSRDELLAAGASALAASPEEVLRGLLERSPRTPKNF